MANNDSANPDDALPPFDRRPDFLANIEAMAGNAGSYGFAQATADVTGLIKHFDPKSEISLPSYFVQLESEWRDHELYHDVCDLVDEDARAKLITVADHLKTTLQTLKDAQALCDAPPIEGITPADVVARDEQKRQISAVLARLGEDQLGEIIMLSEDVRPLLNRFVDRLIKAHDEKTTDDDAAASIDALIELKNTHGLEGAIELAERIGQEFRRESTEMQMLKLLGTLNRSMDAKLQNICEFADGLRERLWARVSGPTPN